MNGASKNVRAESLRLNTSKINTQGQPRLKENEAPAPCNECGKELETKRGMRKHIIPHKALATAIGAGLLLGNLDRKEGNK